MAVLSSQVERESDVFRRRHERMTELVAELRERTALVARDADDAAHALRDEIVAAARRVGPRGAETADRAINQSGIYFRQRLEIHPEAPRHPGPVVLEEYIGPGRQAVQRFYASLHRHGDVKEMLPEMMTRAALYDTISYYDYEALDASIARTVLPEG